MNIDKLKPGRYVICKNDQDKINKWTKTKKTSRLDVIMKKHPSITKGNVYRIFDKKKETKTKKNRAGVNINSTIMYFKIKSDKGKMVWIPIDRFEYNVEVSKNQARFDKIADCLK